MPATTATPPLVEAELPDPAYVEQVAAAGGVGWMVADAGLWRMTSDGSTARIPAFDGFNVQSMVAFGEELVVAGIRCEGEERGRRCDGTPQVRSIERTGREAWTVELSLPDGSGFVGLLGSADEVTWVRDDSGLLAIGPSGEIVRRGPEGRGDPCLIDGDLFTLVGESQMPGTGATTMPGVPPTTQVEPGRVQAEAFMVKEADGRRWRTIEGSTTVVEGPAPAGQCANGGFETWGGAAGVPTERWGPDQDRWFALDVPTALDPLLGPPARTTEGVEYVIARDSGAVLRRVPEELAYEPVGLTLDNAGLGQPGVALVVGEDGDTVFACVSPDAVTSCGFGQQGS